jgi:hypothetical protein
VTDPQRERIVAAFDRELARSPLPPELRSQAVRGAVGKRNEPSHTRQQWALALVATVVAVAIVATLVLGTRTLRTVPAKVGPPATPRAGASLAFDEARGEMVLFGGSTQRGIVNETWTWDGKSWTQHHPAVVPPARQEAAMAYDQARQRTVLYGGVGNATTGKGMVQLNDTWTWDGQSWREEHPTVEPLKIQEPGMSAMPLAYDPTSRLVIGFLVEPNPTQKPHTFGWNGTTWQELHPGTQPPSMMGSLVSDGTRLLYITQPYGTEGGRYVSQTWAWDGRNWLRLVPRVNLPPAGANTVRDRSSGLVLALNGDTWTWDGSTWSRQHPTVQPSAGAYLAYMPSLKRVIAWGDRFSSQNGDLLAWDGSNWTMLKAGPPIPTPEGRGSTVQGTMSPADAEVSIRKTVTTAHPVLLPSRLPNAIVDAAVSAGADGFSVVYRSDQRDKSISLGIVAANPPPGTEQTVTRAVKFHGVTAQYQDYDPASPLSRRWLMWNEPGTMAEQVMKVNGVPYFLSTDGLTDQEFWEVANSLR